MPTRRQNFTGGALCARKRWPNTFFWRRKPPRHCVWPPQDLHWHEFWGLAAKNKQTANAMPETLESGRQEDSGVWPPPSMSTCINLTKPKKLKQATLTTSRTHDSILATPAINLLSINLVIVIISFVIFTTFQQLYLPIPVAAASSDSARTSSHQTQSSRVLDPNDKYKENTLSRSLVGTHRCPPNVPRLRSLSWHCLPDSELAIPPLFIRI